MRINRTRGQGPHVLQTALQAVPWWADEAGPFEARPALQGDVRADVCVIGGGYTGLWTAHALKQREPSAHVVVLEADVCGAGPSGRNGSFLHGYWASLGELVPLLGRDSALDLDDEWTALPLATRASRSCRPSR